MYWVRNLENTIIFEIVVLTHTRLVSQTRNVFLVFL